MAQPPGSDTFALPQRATSGASTQKLARMRATISYGAVVSTISGAVSRNVWPSLVRWPDRLPAMVTSTP
jgi:hypothetical protein